MPVTERTDEQNLAHFEQMLKKIVIKFFEKKMTEEEFTDKHRKCCGLVEHYRKKLGKPSMFEDDDTVDDDDLLQLTLPSEQLP